MPNKEDEFYQRLLATFKVEAGEHLQTISDGLLALEKIEDPVNQTVIIETIFREAHSLKGAARAVNLREIEEVCQPLESLLALWKNKTQTPTPELFELVYRAVTVLENMISASGFSETHAAEVDELAKLLTEAGTAGQKTTPPQESAKEIVQPPPAANAEGGRKLGGSSASNFPGTLEVQKFYEKPGLTDTVRVATGKLDALLLQAEELIAAKLIVGQRAADLRESFSDFGNWHKMWARIQPQFRHIGQLGAQTSDK